MQEGALRQWMLSVWPCATKGSGLVMQGGGQGRLWRHAVPKSSSMQRMSRQWWWQWQWNQGSEQEPREFQSSCARCVGSCRTRHVSRGVVQADNAGKEWYQAPELAVWSQHWQMKATLTSANGRCTSCNVCSGQLGGCRRPDCK